MSARHPSRIALAVFDCFISDNDPLRGDLFEEFEARQSQFWLWRQVLSAAAHSPWLRGAVAPGDLVLGAMCAAMLLLLAFEAVFVTNTIYRFMFGPPLQDISGHLYLLPPLFQPPPSSSSASSQPFEIWRAVVALVTALPVGWLVARLRERHRVLALVAFSVSITACAALNIQVALSVQFLTTAIFVLSLLLAGTIETMADAQPRRT
jgi:hypothetical protein